MKIRSIKFPVLFLLVGSLAFASFRQSSKKQSRAKATSGIVTGSYAQQWLRVDSLSKKGLSKSALEAVMGIYKKARTENNAPQLVKSVIHRIKFQSYTEEDAVKKMIAELKKDATEAHFPARPLLHSMLAETYWRFYEQNRYLFLNRTETVEYKNDDVNTWDLKKILKETIHEFNLSLADADSAKRARTTIYDEVIEKGKPEVIRNYRPALYDFLAHRALGFYKNDETGLTEPANKFEINNALYISSADRFIKVSLKTEDTLSLKFRALLLFQQLMAFHKQDDQPGALIDVDLQRLKFVYDHLTIADKDSLYVKALLEIEIKYSGYPGCTDALYELAALNYNWGSRYAYGDKPEAKPLIKKARTICEDAISRFPDSPGALKCKALKSRIEEKAMTFTVEQVNIPGRPFLAKLDFKNVRKVFFRIAKNDLNEPGDRTDLYGDKLIDHYLKLPLISQWALDVDDDGDYQAHSAGIKIPELPVGNYVILAASNSDFSYKKNGVAYASCWISEISYVSRRRDGGVYDYYLLNRETGEPIPGVTASLFIQQYDQQARKYMYNKVNTYTSDSEGHLSVEAVGEYRNFNIEFTKGNDRLFLNDNFYQYRNDRSGKIMRQQTFFFTDRSIYRPGQTVYFKGVTIETDGEKNSIRTKQSTTVTLYDVNGQKVSDQAFVTNEYGTFSGSFTSPIGLLNGMMRISNENGTAYFSVEEYKRPKFEVRFEPVTGAYRLNDKILVTGKAISYAGASIDQAQVQYRVVRTALFPYWNYYWRAFPSSPEMEINNGTTTTNGKGEFSISFDAIPDRSIDPESSPVFNFNVSANVTDLNGETQSESQSVSVGYKALLLSINLPPELNRDRAGDFVISTKNLSGVSVNANGNISIVKLKEPLRLLRKMKWTKPEKMTISKGEFEKIFPNDVYEGEDNPEKWDIESKLYGAAFDTEKDSTLHLPELRIWKQGTYKLEATSKDKYNQDVKWTKYFTLYSAKEKEAPVNSMNWFTVLKDKEEPGGTDQILIGTRDRNVKVLYEIEQKNEIISKQWLTLSNEQRLIEIPVLESHRGNIAVHFTFVKHNRDFHFDHVLTVPYTNKQLDISFETFRSKLYPGQKEEWKMKIKGKKGEKIAAEMLASMYDASLDAFRPHNWLFNIYNSYYSSLSLSPFRSFGVVSSNLFSHEWNIYFSPGTRTYDQLNWFGFSGGGNQYYRGGKGVYGADASAVPMQMATKSGNVVMEAESAPPGKLKESIVGYNEFESTKDEVADKKTGGKSQDLTSVKSRSNFNETAFFYPHLVTNDSGEVSISFTMPEALTRWKMMGFATTKDLKYGLIEKELITQKELMVVPNPPRFFREGDKISFTTKITNLSDSSLTGTAKLFLYDAITMQALAPSPLNKAEDEVSFTATKGQSATAEWNLTIPENVDAITYKVVARSGSYSDGEEQTIPVLSNRMLVTETLPLPVRGKQNKSFEFAKLKNSGASSTLRHRKLTLEFTSNPAWYAVQALPYMMEYPYDCSEQIFSRYYANAIASHIANSSPKIKAIFDSWKSKSPEAFLSNLEKNQELKTLMLEETPWVLEAKDETERKKRIGLLFDLNKMANESNTALLKLQKKQLSNGAWSWFEGMPDDRYITQYIVEGFGHLDRLGIKSVREDEKTWNMLNRAVEYLDARIMDDYNQLLGGKADASKNHLSSTQIQYLYARSYFKDVRLGQGAKTAFDFYKKQSKKFWLDNSEYLQGMIALALFRYDDKETPSDILKSLKENSQNSEELGMYWKNNVGGYFWTQAPVETQALLIEAFDEIAADEKAVDDMKTWLLKQKQTQDWKTTKATAEACYALLLKGTNWLADALPVEITIGGRKINREEIPDSKAEAGTGYFKTSWNGTEIKPEMASVKVENKNDVVAWGALYWQYFEQMDKITPHQTPLNLKKELFLERPSSTGPVITPVTTGTSLKPGDRIKVRIELRVDRDMEYVMMKDMRAAGLEPEQVLSHYKWQGGLGYYESTRDASVNFFFSWLQKGVYVFEYPLRVSHKGDFSNGITEIQCMYAPEFSAHSEGVRLMVKQ